MLQPTLSFRALCRVGRLPLLAAALLLTAAVRHAGAAPAPEAQAAMASVRAEGIRAHVHFLADESLEGRDTGSRGGLIAANYLASQLDQLGLQPGGDKGSFLQHVPLLRRSLKLDKTHLAIAHGGNETELKIKEQYFFNSMPPEPGAWKNLPLVFGGYGVTAAEYGYDDYKNLDVAGKIVVMLGYGLPRSPEPGFFEGGKARRYDTPRNKLGFLAGHGALGAIMLVPPERENPRQWEQDVHLYSQPFLMSPGYRSGLNVVMRLKDAASLFDGAETAWEQLQKQIAEGCVRPCALAASVNFQLAEDRSDVETQNVVGMVPGSDPVLSKQAVVFAAHADHLGKSDDGTKVFPGAWDNASGCAELLEIARAFAAVKPAPKRSMVFLFTTAEERGMHGAKFYTAHPLVPLKDTAACINVDMGDIFGIPKDIVPVGAEHSSLKEFAAKAASELSLKLTLDPTPEMHSFERSDQYVFAANGVPSLYLRWGTTYATPISEADLKNKLESLYHEPADKFDPSWSWEGMRLHAQAAFLIGLEVAKDPQLPKWNDGDPFSRPRFGS